MAWNWQVFCRETTTGETVVGCFGRGGDETYLNWIVTAWGWTLGVALCALVVALVTGLIVGTVRTLPNSPWLVRLGNAWVELFRNIPILVQIFLWYFVIPGIFPVMKQVPSVVLVVIALGLFTAFFGALVSPAYATAAAFGVLIAVLVLRPGGLAVAPGGR